MPESAPRPRLLLLITELVMGGAARVMRDHARMLAPHFETHEVVFDHSLGMDFAGDAPVLSLDDGATSQGPLRPVLNLRRRVRRLKQLKRSLGIEVSVSHLEGAHFVDVLSRIGEKTILCVHGSILHNPMASRSKDWLRRKLLIPLLYNRADRVVTVSRDLVDELVQLGVRRDKIVTINNFFDIERIEELARAPLPPEHEQLFGGAPTLVTTGRLHPQKNHFALIDLFAELRGKRPVGLILVGDGELREALVEHAKGRGLSVAGVVDGLIDASADVVFLGQQDNPFPYVARATIFVLPSLWEGFPLALCEAMACGVPVAASDCPTGPREIIAPSMPAGTSLGHGDLGEHGLLLPMPVDAATRGFWVDALAVLLDDDGRRAALAASGRARVRDFSAERIVPQWLQLIRGLLRA